MSRTAATPGQPGRGRPWILDPWNDLAWFLLAPAWILALAWLVKDWPVLGALGGMFLAVGATGHHLPGFLRAYSDPVLFRRFKARFLAAPAFFLGVSVLFAALDLHGLEVILVLWGAWHGAMQVSGFLRIYDAKAGVTDPATAWLDWSMCATWFAGGLLYSESKLHLLGLTLHRSGIPLPDPETVFAARQSWALLAAGVTCAFLANAAAGLLKGRPSHAMKFLAMGGGVAFWWFCMVEVRIAILGLLIFEIFHDLQYNVLVWTYQRSRIDRGLPTGSLERFLFRPSPARMALYFGLILAYGAMGALANYGGLNLPGGSEPAGWSRLLSHLFIASAFLHFYYDGFIWKLRDPVFRGGMGLAEAPEPRRQAASMRPEPEGRPAAGSGFGWLPAGLKAALFAVPTLALGYSELRNAPAPKVEALRSLAPLLPRTWEAQLALGSLEMEAGNAGAAAAGLARAFDLNPDLDLGGRGLLARLYAQAGDSGQAILEYRRAVAEDPGDMRSRYDLGLLLRSQGRIGEAITELRTVADRHPENGGTNYSAGFALLLSRRVTEAIPYLERCVAADSNHKLGWNYLGVARESQGRLSEALACYRRALAVDTGFAEALRNLRQAETRLRGAGPGKAGDGRDADRGRGASGAAGFRPSGLPEEALEQRAGLGEVVLEPGQVGFDEDGIAFPCVLAMEEDPAPVAGYFRFPEPDAVHGDAGAAGQGPFPEGGEHLRLHLVAGQVAGGYEEGCQHGRRGDRLVHDGKASRRRIPWQT